jgi:hypothetical protein
MPGAAAMLAVRTLTMKLWVCVLPEFGLEGRVAGLRAAEDGGDAVVAVGQVHGEEVGLAGGVALVIHLEAVAALT